MVLEGVQEVQGVQDINKWNVKCGVMDTQRGSRD